MRRTILALSVGCFSICVQAQSVDDILKQVVKPAAPKSATSSAVSSTDANAGLKLALSKASDAVVGQLGVPGGFSNDPLVRIGLPGPLAKLGGVLQILDTVGVTKGLSAKLNSAAEGAVSKATPLLKNAIQKMSVTDAIGIVTGGQTSATDYFKRTMSAQLQTEMLPVVSKSLKGVDAFSALNSVIAKNKLPIGQFGDKDLTSYVTQKASDGVFYYLGEKEKEIRANPLGFGSDLIARVFAKY
jgi:hypothetical protein